MALGHLGINVTDLVAARVITTGSCPCSSTSPYWPTAHSSRTGQRLGIIHAPQEFPQYPPPYYATFWIGYDGVMLEAVCHKDA